VEFKKQKLDLKDKKLLYYLLRDSRMPFTEIAKSVGLSKESVQYRYLKLLERKVIKKTYARVDFEKLGFQRFNLLLLVDEKDKKKQRELMKALANHPNVVRINEFSDSWDFEISMIARNVKEFDDKVNELISPFSNIVIRKDEEVVIVSKYNHSFSEVHNLKLKDIKAVRTTGQTDFDDYDLQILNQLSKDARISTYKIAEQVKLSPDTIGLRIKKMLKNGIIERFTCLLNFLILDYEGFIFCFNTASLSKEDEVKFFYFMANQPNVFAVKKILGSWNFKNYVFVKKSLDFHNLIKEIKNKFSGIVHSYETWVVYEESYYNPFPEVLDGVSL